MFRSKDQPDSSRRIYRHFSGYRDSFRKLYEGFYIWRWSQLFDLWLEKTFLASLVCQAFPSSVLKNAFARPHGQKSLISTKQSYIGRRILYESMAMSLKKSWTCYRPDCSAAPSDFVPSSAFSQYVSSFWNWRHGANNRMDQIQLEVM